MKDQINTIRSELTSLHGIVGDLSEALTALAQIEAAVGEPVAKLHDDGYWTPMKTEAGRALNDRLMRAGSPPIDVYAAPAAQQPQARPDFTDEWTGYLKNGETPFERFLRERKDLTALTKLYQRALEENESLKAQQPQAEKRCQYCDGTGDVHSIDGQWRGECHCQKQPQAEAVSDDLRDRLVAISQAIADQDDRAAQAMIREILAAPQQAEAVPPGFKLLKDSTHDERSWPEDYSHENGCYSNTCVNCLRNFTGYKRRAVCKVCDAAIAQQKGASHE